MLRAIFGTRDGSTAFRLEGQGLHDQPMAPIEPPFTAAELADIRWYIEDFLHLPLGADLERAGRIEANLRSIGLRLFEAVFPDRNAGRALDRAIEAGEWLEIAAEPGASAAPLGWPWELLADERGFLARRKLRVRRTIPRPGIDGRSKPPSNQGLRVLLIVARPDGAGMVPYDSVDAALRAVDGQPVQLDIAPAGSLDALRACLDRAEDEGHPYDVVHFDGHGNYTAEQGAVLCFEKPATPEMTLPMHRVTPAELGGLLSDKGVDLVLLEACRSSTADGAKAVDDPTAAGFAQGLLRHDVPAVIAMGYTVHVDATKELCAELYARLAAGRTVGVALSAARRRLETRKTRRVGFGPLPARKAVELSDWFVPQLYATPAGDKALLARDVRASAIHHAPTLATLDPQSPTPGAFPPRPPHGVIGRLAELHRLERALHYKPAARIWGLAGMGKTTLARHAAEWLLRTGRIVGAAFVDFTRAVGAEYARSQMSAGLMGGEGTPDRAALVQWFRRNPVLVVWDNLEVLTAPEHAAEAAAMQRLFDDLTGDDGGPPARGRVLITTRDPAQFTAAWPIALGGLWRPDARALLDRALQRRAQPSTYAAEVRREGQRALPDPAAIKAARIHGPDAPPDPARVAEAREQAGRAAIDTLLTALADHPLSIALVGPALGPQRPGAIVAGLAERLAAADDEPGDDAGRMRTLRAALDWSIGQLGAEAREALPWLALFRGGVFELALLAVSEMPPARWAAARVDLTRTGLVRVDAAVQIAERPFLTLHPTLALLDDGGRAADPAVRARFVAVYGAVIGAVDRALGSQQAAFRWALAVFGRAEVNLRRALGWAEGDRAAFIQRNMVDCLNYTGRRAAAEALSARQVRGELSVEARARGALDRLGRDPAGALAELRALAAATPRDPGADPFDAGIALLTLGRALDTVGQPQRAIAALRAAVERWRAAAAARPDDPALAGNLSATLGDLGTALLKTGDLPAAEAAIREGLALDERRGNGRSVAAGRGQLAQLAMSSGRFDDARAEYARARGAADALGDDEMIGIVEQHLGGLEDGLGQYDAAINHYRRALDRFLAAHNRPEAMRTRDLLGTAWRQQGDRAAARGWYRAALADAEALGDRGQQAITRHNLGILEMNEADAARAADRPAVARRHLAAAAAHVEAALAILRTQGDISGEARSLFQLGVIYRRLDRLPDARDALEAGLAIRARLGAPDLHKDHANLAAVYAALGDPDAAARHRAAADTAEALADYNARRHLFLVNLAQLAAAARDRRGLPPALRPQRDALATLPAWLGALAGFFTALADADVARPTLPAALPDDLRQTLDAVLAGADPFDALPPEVRANPQIRAAFGRSTPDPAPPPALPPTVDLFRHLCLAVVAPEPHPALEPTLAALATSPDPEHRAIAAHITAHRAGQPLPDLPPHLAAIAAEILPG